jgi:adenine-specific DNA-methyltransferase
MPTPHHAAYLAHCLTASGTAGDIDSLSRSISRSRVDLNPHQVDAALAALHSPLARGIILADEVGLGKTIEAGIVMTQSWAENKRRMLLIVPATLRKQWQSELIEKFGLPSVVLDGPAVKAANLENAFDRHRPEVVICSYDLASRYNEQLRAVIWDLVIIDEAHRLRNVWKTDSVVAANIRDATNGRKKLLLTATPLQNNLLELYGLLSVIDDQVFGSIEAFREQFVGNGTTQTNFDYLRERLQPFVARTLRRQVRGFVNFTQRTAFTIDFEPTPPEQELYDGVTAYLQIPELHALPRGQRALMTLVLRKLLASSTFAIAATLHRMADRVRQRRIDEGQIDSTHAGAQRQVLSDYEAEDELLDEIEEGQAQEDGPESMTQEEEYREIKRLANLAESISENAKGEALIRGLEKAFAKTDRTGAARKAVIFTESKRTQAYLYDRLSDAGYAQNIVCINGDNRGYGAPDIYKSWVAKHEGTDKVSGAKSADIKAALVEEFRDRATLLIATESAAEGVNLQFCSLLINYDLPWNPQRVEQRIGRIHRYGQAHDVLILNFLNTANAADRRVHQLLSLKFQLFEGVFGASDEVLGALESGVDFERRIASILQTARSGEEIEKAFDELQDELDEVIRSRMDATRTAVLDHLDDTVAARLRVHREQANQALDERQKLLLRFTKLSIPANEAVFQHELASFTYSGSSGVKGNYYLDWRQAEAQGGHFYHEDVPLARHLIDEATGITLGAGVLNIDYSAAPQNLSILKEHVGQQGWIACELLSVSGATKEEFVLLSGCCDGIDGEILSDEVCKKMMEVSIASIEEKALGNSPGALALARERSRNNRLDVLQDRNQDLFKSERQKLENFTADKKIALRTELDVIERELKLLRTEKRSLIAWEAMLEVDERINRLRKRQREKQMNIFEAENELEDQLDELISNARRALRQTSEIKPIWILRWALK